MTKKAAPRAPKRLHRLSISVDDETLEKLRQIATGEHRTVANLIMAWVKDRLAEPDQ